MNLNNTSDQMPEFIPILVAGLIVFMGLLLAFGGLITPVSEVGDTVTMKTITIATDFTVSDVTEEELLETVENSTVSSGLATNVEDSISFELPRLADASEGVINFHVINTNLYGPLIFEVNGNQVYADFSRKGDHTITFTSEFLELDNVVDMKAGSSGWRLWAPTIYIFDANFSVIYFGKKTLDTTFNLTEKPEDITKAKIVLSVKNRSGTGKIRVKLNDIMIYSGYGVAGLEFSKDRLKEGENKVEISTESDALYGIDAVNINVWS